MKTLREKAEEIKAKGSPLTIEQIISFLIKQEASKAKREKRSAKSWKKREEFNKAGEELNAKLEKMTIKEKTNFFEQIKIKSIQNQMPSSMRY